VHPVRRPRQDASSILPWPPLHRPNSFEACNFEFEACNFEACNKSVEREQSREVCIAQSVQC